jgi:multicomponent K+:H+ antiporter subunit G
MMPLWADVMMALVLVAGGAFALIGSIGLVRFDDFMKRVHGPTKASTLGVGSVLIASILYFSTTSREISLHEVLITVFVFITAPVSAHMLVKALVNKEDALVPPHPVDGDGADADASPTPSRDRSRIS